MSASSTTPALRKLLRDVEIARAAAVALNADQVELLDLAELRDNCFRAVCRRPRHQRSRTASQIVAQEHIHLMSVLLTLSKRFLSTLFLPYLVLLYPFNTMLEIGTLLLFSLLATTILGRGALREATLTAKAQRVVDIKVSVA